MQSLLRNAAIGLTLAALATVAQAKDLPEVGTWKLNVEKWRYSPGPMPKSLTAKTAERTDKKAGKVMLTQTREVAKDGKSFTVVITGTNDKGEAVNNRLFFE